MEGPLTLIVNPSAGGGRAAKILPELRELLAAAGVDTQVQTTRSLDDGKRMAREAANSGRIAGAVGGDGLIGAVASGCSESNGVMAIFPGGRGNDLARVLGIGSAPADAVSSFVGGVEKALDLGRAGDRTFCCIASLGFDSDANRIANETRIPGSLAYTWAALRALISWKTATFTLELDGERSTLRGYSVIVANSKAYGGGMFIAPDASLEDGLFDVVTIGDDPKLKFLRLLPTVFKGEHIHTDAVTVRRARSVRIEADRPFVVYADGDPLCEIPATIEVAPSAVRTVVPA
jgi:YegS/Rv2252/BmrU family lipid kinase